MKEDVATWASNIKTMLQMLIGVGLIGVVFIRLFHDLGLADLPSLSSLYQVHILQIVGDALLYASAIELAYTLFTPGPDEAVNPLITGLAAIILLGIAQVKYEDIPHTDEITRNVSIYVIVLMGLFLIRKWFIDKEQQG